nr:unnamed protein product [Callosobruchus chinensis]
MDAVSPPSDHSGFSLDVGLSTLKRDWVNLVSTSEKDEYDIRDSRIPQKSIRKQQLFCTGSKYSGQTNNLGFSGVGTYTYPHGVTYEGSFFDGRFHGEGSLIYPNGSRVLGRWKKGKMVEHRFFFGDGLEVGRPWTYLDFPDRMMHGEGKDYFEYNEDVLNSVSVGKDCYDTKDGFYNPHTKCVHDKYLKIIRIVTPAEERQITGSFRARIGRRVGFRPDLYECWTFGGKDDVELIRESQKSEKLPSEMSAQSLFQQELNLNY